MQLSATEMVQRLIASGMTETELADQVGIRQPTAHRIKTGAGTSYEVGKKIEAIYAKRFGTAANTKQRGSRPAA